VRGMGLSPSSSGGQKWTLGAVSTTRAATAARVGIARVRRRVNIGFTSFPVGAFGFWHRYGW